MEIEKVNWLELTESQKADVLKQAKAYLRQQMEEAAISKGVMEALSKYGAI